MVPDSIPVPDSCSMAAGDSGCLTSSRLDLADEDLDDDDLAVVAVVVVVVSSTRGLSSSD